MQPLQTLLLSLDAAAVLSERFATYAPQPVGSSTAGGGVRSAFAAAVEPPGGSFGIAGSVPTNSDGALGATLSTSQREVQKPHYAAAAAGAGLNCVRGALAISGIWVPVLGLGHTTLLRNQLGGGVAIPPHDSSKGVLSWLAN